MTTRTLNIKLPTIVLESYANVPVKTRNKVFVSHLKKFQHLNSDGVLVKYQFDQDKQMGGLHSTIGVKVDKQLHSDLKLAAIQQGVSLSEYAGQVICRMPVIARGVSKQWSTN